MKQDFPSFSDVVPMSISDFAAFNPEEQACMFFKRCLEATRSHEVVCASLQALLLRRVFLLCVACPVALFAILLPLELEGWKTLKEVYIKVLLELICTAFARINILTLWGAAPPIWFTVLFLCLASVATILIPIVSAGSLAILLETAITCLCVFMPSIWLACAYGLRNADCLWYMLGMGMGSIPTFFAIFGYFVVEHTDLPLWVALLAWILLPFPLKSAGKKVFRKGSPVCKAFGPVMWAFYVDAAFSCLGTAIFMVSSLAAVSYAASTGPILLSQMMLGTPRGYRLAPRLSSLRSHRLLTLLEAFGATLGRTAGLTFYSCYCVYTLIFRSGARRRLTDSPSEIRVRDVYFQAVADEISAGLAVAGFFIIVVLFAIFFAALPRMWVDEPAAQRRLSGVSPKEEYTAHEMEVGKLSSCGQPAQAWGEQPSSLPWTGGATRREADAHQVAVLQEYAERYFPYFVSVVFFELVFLMHLGHISARMKSADDV